MTGSPKADPRLAISLALGAFALFTAMDTIIKWVSRDWPIAQIIFCNAIVGLVPMLVWCRFGPGWGVLRTRRPLVHAIRSTLGVAAAYGAFYGYSRMALADAYTINFTAPLMITSLSVPILGERVGWRRWTAVVVGFCGVLVMLRPGAGMLDPAAAGVFLGAAGYAVSMLIVRRYGQGESSVSFAFYGFATQALLVLPVLVFDHVRPQPEELALMVLSGLLAGTALLMLITAFLRGNAAIVAPFQYSQLLWGTVAGWLVWDQLPSGRTLVGAAIVVASGLYILHRETRLKAAVAALSRPARP